MQVHSSTTLSILSLKPRLWDMASSRTRRAGRSMTAKAAAQLQEHSSAPFHLARSAAAGPLPVSQGMWWLKIGSVAESGREPPSTDLFEGCSILQQGGWRQRSAGVWGRGPVPTEDWRLKSFRKLLNAFLICGPPSLVPTLPIQLIPRQP